jgi:hypothetical protein
LLLSFFQNISHFQFGLELSDLDATLDNFTPFKTEHIYEKMKKVAYFLKHNNQYLKASFFKSSAVAVDNFLDKNFFSKSL